MRRILGIEDDDVVRELMRMTLQKRGYEVTVAEDGVRGYDTTLFFRPDLIITDIRMPGADGIHVVRRVRDTESLEKTPILVTTAFGDDGATFSATGSERLRAEVDRSTESPGDSRAPAG